MEKIKIKCKLCGKEFSTFGFKVEGFVEGTRIEGDDICDECKKNTLGKTQEE